MREDSSLQLPIAPIFSNTVEQEERRFVGNKVMSGYHHLSFGDLLALANSASLCFSGQITKPTSNESVESSTPRSVSNSVAELIINTPEKPKRKKKHRPKVRKEAKPKKPPKPPAPKKAVAAVPQEGQKPKRKYVRKKVESTPVVESSAALGTSTPVKKLCRRALRFESENHSNSGTKQAAEMESEKVLDSGNQEAKGCLLPMPSTPKRKRSQSKRKGKEPENNGCYLEEADISMAQAAKRRQVKETKTGCDMNLSEIQYDELCDYQKMHWLYFSNLPQEGLTSGAIYTQARADRVLTTEEKREGTRQQSEFNKIDTPIKKTTTGHARFRNLSSMENFMEVSELLPSGHHSKPQEEKDNKIIVDTRVTVSKKKRITKSAKSQTNQNTSLPTPFQFPASISGLSPDELWKQRYSVEAISEQLRVLDINRENSETALVPYSMKTQGNQNQIVIFGGSAGAIVPVTPVKKQRRPRPKVELDDETDRVWKLLLENINSEGIDGSDEQKAKWWEEERNVFRGRADSFIARMHLVQGDRRFTPWKGSVVDSVVGVFLTQNVSDHLSSSAFMSLAAEFPVPSVPSSNFDVGTSSMPSIQITYLDSEESMSNPPDHNQGSVSLKNTQPNEEQDYVNSNETSRTSSSEITTASKTYVESDRLGSSVEVDKTDQECFVLNLFPSEDSALTYQHSTVSEVPQNTERAGSISEVSLEEEYRTSYMKLLQGLDGSNQYENSRQEVGVSSNHGSFQASASNSEFKNVLSCTQNEMPETSSSEVSPTDVKAKGKKILKEKKKEFDWDSLRREAEGREGKREKTIRTMDTVDWEAIRTADVSEVAETIKSRGMNHKLAERIQGFLDRLLTDHGSMNLEWLRDVPPDKAKEYLLSFNGLGLKSVECVRLLTLHHLAFPVDTNVGRIAVRLGWVPLQPLPESLQLHLLEMYPVLESIQKYLWPRLCKFDQKTLYELHYQMITFGKVFCTKSKPNCNACPMRGECRHFASAFASARLALPSTEKGMGTPDKNPLPLHLPEPVLRDQGSEVVKYAEPAKKFTCCEPIIEEPASPEPESVQVSIADIEDAFFEDPEEIPTIRLNMDAFTSNLKKIMEHSKALQDGNMSSALVALTAETASLPMPKLKNISQLRTEHQVYELHDGHPLLVKMEKRDPDDPCRYLLAIWTPGETADSIQPAGSKCIYQSDGKLCDEETCFTCNSIREARSQTVRGTILIPCRTAMRGSFPLNGTYFQVNEVFADHASSLNPIDVSRDLIWYLPKKTVYFGTSIPSIFKGLPTDKIQECFWRGYVCVRGFDRKTRAPKPLIARLHFPASKMKAQQANLA